MTSEVQIEIKYFLMPMWGLSNPQMELIPTTMKPIQVAEPIPAMIIIPQYPLIPKQM